MVIVCQLCSKILLAPMLGEVFERVLTSVQELLLSFPFLVIVSLRHLFGLDTFLHPFLDLFSPGVLAILFLLIFLVLNRVDLLSLPLRQIQRLLFLDAQGHVG